MSLAPGARIGPYEVLAPVGAGGMGEVFRARDSRLNRDVAIKRLPMLFAQDGERVARFRREAQVVAALNHPNVAAIYGLEEADGVVALALEYVEGEDLAQRLRRGAIPVDEAIGIARQIADGLEAAHEKGIVHRDLKPANVKLRSDGTVKILDFGLARAGDGDGAVSSDSNLAHSPTMARPMTDAGVILGTAAYMSPEQARGKPVDKRSDIWSFGVVLFEMLTGRRVFSGETVSDTLASVLREPVDFRELPAETPPSVRALLERCLDRDPRKRLRDVGEARVALEGGATVPAIAGGAIAAAAPAPRRARLAWSIAALLALAAGALAWMQFGRTPEPRRSLRFTFEPPPGVAFDSAQNDFFTISPNGKMLAFTGRTPDGKRSLWVRPLDSFEARPLPDSDDALEPFWSPDSRSIAFGSKGKLKRVDLGGGRATTLADAPRLVGGGWGRQGVIVFVPDFNAPVHRVSAGGGDSRVLTPIDTRARETAQRYPSFLPDGNHYLYGTNRDGRQSIVLTSLESPEPKVLLTGVGYALYAPPGWLLFPRDGEQWAQRFDPETRELSGEPVNLSGSSGASEIAAPIASDDGVLVWRRLYRPDYQLVWFDRTGKRLGTVGPPVRVALTMAPRLSPDERMVAIQNRDSENDRLGIWVIDLQSGVPTRLTSVLSQFPQWSPDGKRVAWVYNRSGAVGIYQRAPDGSTPEEIVLLAGSRAGATTFPADWSADGRFLLYWSRGSKTRTDTWVLPLTGERTPRPLLASEFEDYGTQISPDGRWLAYRSDVSGSYEIYLQSFTADGHAGPVKIRVTQTGGSQPRFRGDSRELFYLGPDGRMMSADLEPQGDTVRVSEPRALFQTRVLPAGSGSSFEYDVTTDGQRFLIGTVLDTPNAPPPSPVIVVDWTRELPPR